MTEWYYDDRRSSSRGNYTALWTWQQNAFRLLGPPCSAGLNYVFSFTFHFAPVRNSTHKNQLPSWPLPLLVCRQGRQASRDELMGSRAGSCGKVRHPCLPLSAICRLPQKVRLSWLTTVLACVWCGGAVK